MARANFFTKIFHMNDGKFDGQSADHLLRRSNLCLSLIGGAGALIIMGTGSAVFQGYSQGPIFRAVFLTVALFSIPVLGASWLQFGVLSRSVDDKGAADTSKYDDWKKLRIQAGSWFNLGVPTLFVATALLIGAAWYSAYAPQAPTTPTINISCNGSVGATGAIGSNGSIHLTCLR